MRVRGLLAKWFTWIAGITLWGSEDCRFQIADCRLKPTINLKSSISNMQSFGHPDPSLALADSLQPDLHIPLAFKARKFFTPLDQKHAFVSYQIVDPECLQLTRSINAV